VLNQEEKGSKGETRACAVKDEGKPAWETMTRRATWKVGGEGGLFGEDPINGLGGDRFVFGARS